MSQSFSVPKASGIFRVVCLGGSAGGLEAYLTILCNVPPDTGMGFVVAPHRGIEHSHLLPMLLARVTKMPVTEVTQGMRIETNKVFIMPPRQEMRLDGDIFHLSSAPPPFGWPKTSIRFCIRWRKSAGIRPSR